MTEADFMLPQDKANHMVYGAAIFVVLAFFFTPGWAMVGCALGGAGKEAVDEVLNIRQHKKGLPETHDPSPWDFLATCTGGLLPYLAVLAS